MSTNHQIGNYLKDLAALFHGWYIQDGVKFVDETNIPLSQARLFWAVECKAKFDVMA